MRGVVGRGVVGRGVVGITCSLENTLEIPGEDGKERRAGVGSAVVVVVVDRNIDLKRGRYILEVVVEGESSWNDRSSRSSSRSMDGSRI